MALRNFVVYWSIQTEQHWKQFEDASLWPKQKCDCVVEIMSWGKCQRLFKDSSCAVPNQIFPTSAAQTTKALDPHHHREPSKKRKAGWRKKQWKLWRESLDVSRYLTTDGLCGFKKQAAGTNHPHHGNIQFNVCSVLLSHCHLLDQAKFHCIF